MNLPTRIWSLASTSLILTVVSTSARGAELTVGAGQAYATVQTAVDAAQPGDEVVVYDGNYEEDVDLDGNGTAEARITLRPADGNDPVITGQMTIEGSFWDVVNLTLVARAGGRGIRLRGDDNRILGVDLSGGDRNGIDGSGLRNEVRGSHIHDFDAGQSDAHCIVINPGAEDWTIADNDLHDCSGDCLQLYSEGVERSIRNVLVENNDMYFTGALSRTENAIDVKNGDGLVIRHNRMRGFPDNKVVVFQKGPANIEMTCNVMYDGFTGVEFRGEDGGTVENVVFARNLMHDFSEYALKFDGTDGAEVLHNTFVGIGNDGLRIEGAGLDQGTVRNNLWVDTGTVEGGSFVADHNGYFNAATDIGAPSDVVADPMLGLDYRLLDGSPMIDAGADLGREAAGAAPDIGWHELGLDACAAPSGQGGAGGGGGMGVGGGATTGGATTGGNTTSAGSGAGPGAGAASGEDGGCGCATPGRETDRYAWAWLALGVAATLRRRRAAR